MCLFLVGKNSKPTPRLESKTEVLSCSSTLINVEVLIVFKGSYLLVVTLTEVVLLHNIRQVI